MCGRDSGHPFFMADAVRCEGRKFTEMSFFMDNGDANPCENRVASA